jgi:ribosomal protein S18 acetylase RimI-like enzyme
MIKLIPMSEEEFQVYYNQAVQGYAAEHVKSGRWQAETAEQEAKREYDGLLPQGVASPNQFLFTIQEAESGVRVGMIWYALRPSGPKQVAFIYDVSIEPEHRRKGYAQAAFQALEGLVQAQGVSSIDLHVFGHNRSAIALYEKLGFQATNLLMRKTLGEAE